MGNYSIDPEDDCVCESPHEMPEAEKPGAERCVAVWLGSLCMWSEQALP